jgi:hypothetical protein
MHFQGKVTRQKVGTASKSDHAAVVLQTDNGALKLRRVGGNPFKDAELEKLVGHVIDCEGQLHQGQLLLTDWKLL